MQNSIWQFIDTRQFGGIESHVKQLSLALNSRGLDTKVVLFNAYNLHHPMADQLRMMGVDVLDCGGSIRGMLALIMEEQPLLIHTHGYKAGLLGRLAGALCSTPIVSTYHAGEKCRGKLAIYNALDCVTGIFSQKRFAVSQHIAQRVLGKTEVINNFVDVGICPKSKGCQLAFVGRLSHEKGADRIVELADRLGEFTIHVYGDGPLRNSIADQGKANIVLHGSVSNMAEVWPKIQMLLMPSRFEGLPLAAIEAMAHHIPVAAFDVGGLPRLINHGIDGWLVPQGDIEKLARVISTWGQADRPMRDAVGSMARQKIEDQFSSAALIPFYETAYSQVVKKEFCKIFTS